MHAASPLASSPTITTFLHGTIISATMYIFVYLSVLLGPPAFQRSLRSVGRYYQLLPGSESCKALTIQDAERSFSFLYQVTSLPVCCLSHGQATCDPWVPICHPARRPRQINTNCGKVSMNIPCRRRHFYLAVCTRSDWRPVM